MLCDLCLSKMKKAGVYEDALAFWVHCHHVDREVFTIRRCICEIHRPDYHDTRLGSNMVSCRFCPECGRRL